MEIQPSRGRYLPNAKKLKREGARRDVNDYERKNLLGKSNFKCDIRCSLFLTDRVPGNLLLVTELKGTAGEPDIGGPGVSDDHDQIVWLVAIPEFVVLAVLARLVEELRPPRRRTMA